MVPSMSLKKGPRSHGEAPKMIYSSLRTTRTLSKAKRKPITYELPPQSTCAYCGNHATSWDHVIPYAITQKHRRENLVPACMKCNGIASAKVFDSFEEKRLYILDRLAHTKNLTWVYCPKGCGGTYARVVQRDQCPDCGELV